MSPSPLAFPGLVRMLGVELWTLMPNAKVILARNAGSHSQLLRCFEVWNRLVSGISTGSSRRVLDYINHVNPDN